MEIKTNYGTIDYEDIELFDLSKETLSFIEKQKEAAEIFFGTEIDLTDADIRFDEEIKELAEVAIAENKYTYPEKAFALAEHTDETFEVIEEAPSNPDMFEIGSDTYYVLTDEEADDYAKERVTDLLDDIGIEGLSESAKEYIYANFVDTKWFDEAMAEHNDSYTYEIKEERSSDKDVYVNRLHEEMVERGIMEEPEWPEEDEYEREDFVREVFSEPEPDADDFDSDDEYSVAYDAWEERESDFEAEQDRLEEEWDEEQDRIENENSDRFDDAVDEYRYELEQEVENKIDDFVESMNNDYEDGLDYFSQHFGSEEVERIAKENDLVKIDEVVDYIIEIDGRGYSIAPDGGEDSIVVTYKKEKYEFYIYNDV